MSATTDLILERRRVRRRLTFWRILAIVALVALGAALIPWPDGEARGAHVARISISGIILDDRDRAERIEEIAESGNVQALVVHINSPGGTVVASEVLYDALREVAEKKPVVAVMSEVAASGGYIAALAAERIWARGNTLTGSIGVYADIPNVAGLLDMIGVEFTKVKSAPLKGEPSIVTEPAPGAFEAQDVLIEDTFNWFKGLVAERRDFSPARIAEVSNGRAYTGRQAVELGLVDAIGDEEDALAWLRETHGIEAGDEGPRDWRWDDGDLPFPFVDLDEAARNLLGLDRPILAPGPRLYALIH